MLEPSPRYSPASVGGGPTTRLQLDTSLETAVDLSRKSATSDIGLKADLEAEQDDSEDEAPLDLKVRRRIMLMHILFNTLNSKTLTLWHCIRCTYLVLIVFDIYRVGASEVETSLSWYDRVKG